MLGQDFSKLKVYIRPGHTDMRKAINGLSSVVKKEMNLIPNSGYLFLFCNRRRNILKILYWDKNGFCLWQKKLEIHKFPWIDNGEEKISLSFQELNWLLSGIDFFKEHKEINFSQIS